MTDKFDGDVESLFPLDVNLKRISQEKSFLNMTRLLAVDLMENPYLTIGSFMKNLTDNDLEEFMELVEHDNETALENMLLITELLANAEGLPSEDLPQLTERCNSMTSYMTIESLARKGLVKVYHENMSFGEEYDKKIVVERISDV